MRALFPYLLAWLLCLTCAPAADKALAFEHGVRPPNGVFDPLGLLDLPTLRQIEEPLPGLLHEESIEVIVVVLDNLDGAPPEFVAKRFADAWCTAPVHAVVLHVPGNEDSPWIYPHGKFLELMQSKAVSERVAQAKRNASREPTEADKVRAATVEAADMLRFWSGGTEMFDTMVSETRKVQMSEAMAEGSVRDIRLYVYVAGGILLVIALLMLLTLRRKPKRRTFPEFQPPTRMGAPFAGGNHAVVSFSPAETTEP